jgi:hypothetical protein
MCPKNEKRQIEKSYSCCIEMMRISEKKELAYSCRLFGKFCDSMRIDRANKNWNFLTENQNQFPNKQRKHTKD